MLRHTGLAEWQWQAGTVAGLIPGRRRGNRAPIGANPGRRGAGGAYGLPVERADVEALAEVGLLTSAGQYNRYDSALVVHAIDAGGQTALVQAWIPADRLRPADR